MLLFDPVNNNLKTLLVRNNLRCQNIMLHFGQILINFLEEMFFLRKMIQILQVSIEQGRALIVDIGKFTIKRISIGLKRFYTFFYVESTVPVLKV